jgi:hypothetical protein
MTKFYVYSYDRPGLIIWANSQREARHLYVTRSGSARAVYVMAIEA